MHAPEAIKEYEETWRDKRRLCSRLNWSNTPMSSSPISISSTSSAHLNILDALVAAPSSDLAEARAAFPTPEPGHLSPDSTFSVDVDLSPTTRVDAVGVEAEVGCMEGGAGAEDTGGAAEVSPEVGSCCAWLGPPRCGPLHLQRISLPGDVQDDLYVSGLHPYMRHSRHVMPLLHAPR